MVLALSILLVITSVLMILLVLLHKGKGSGLSDLFGGGISSSYGGSSVVEKNLDRITIIVGGLWFAGVIALSLVLKRSLTLLKTCWTGLALLRQTRCRLKPTTAL